MGDVLYVAVTNDKYEYILHMADTAEEMAEWAGIKVKSVREQVSRNKRRPPREYSTSKCEYRLRKIIMEDDAE